MSTSDRALCEQLRRAVRMGDESAARRLLKGGVSVKSTPQNNESWLGASLLHDAVVIGNTSLLELLLSHGADVNHTTPDGRTALHVACRSGNKHIVDLLLKHHSDVNLQTKDGRTPLLIAAWKTNQDIALSLLDARAKCNLYDEDGWTALHWAVRSGDTVLVDKLLSRGACVNARDKCGVTPLLVSLHHSAVMKQLISHGADMWPSPTQKSSIQRIVKQCDKSNLCDSTSAMLQTGYNFHTDVWGIKQHCATHLSCHDNENVVQRLTDICRHKIRQRLSKIWKGRRLQLRMNQLPLPRALKDFLLFKNELASV